VKKTTWWLAAAMLVAAATGSTAQVPPPVTHIAIESKAGHFLDSLAGTSRTARIETAACLTSYAVHGDTLVVQLFSRAGGIVSADSSKINTATPYLCGMGVPSPTS